MSAASVPAAAADDGPDPAAGTGPVAADDLDAADDSDVASGPAAADDLDAADAFGHPAIADPTRDDGPWSDGDEDDIDV